MTDPKLSPKWTAIAARRWQLLGRHARAHQGKSNVFKTDQPANVFNDAGRQPSNDPDAEAGRGGAEFVH
ncbi:MAG: hypothetical protein P4M05_05775, partial [Bradyrhizobium sp.]|nr:hypothetical protein [Bradyrhizobium sp.]